MEGRGGGVGRLRGIGSIRGGGGGFGRDVGAAELLREDRHGGVAGWAGEGGEGGQGCGSWVCEVVLQGPEGRAGAWVEAAERGADGAEGRGRAALVVVVCFGLSLTACEEGAIAGGGTAGVGGADFARGVARSAETTEGLADAAIVLFIAGGSPESLLRGQDLVVEAWWDEIGLFAFAEVQTVLPITGVRRNSWKACGEILRLRQSRGVHEAKRWTLIS